MTRNPTRRALALALKVASVALLLAILPFWPYGYYTLLRLVVTGAAIFALTEFAKDDPKRTIGLSITALLFNPVFVVQLPALIWVPIDLGLAYWLWKLAGGASTDSGEG